MTTDPLAQTDPGRDVDRHPSIDDLDRAIRNLAGRINATTHDFVVLIRRFDERAGWLGWGFESLRTRAGRRSRPMRWWRWRKAI